jgi:acyl-CoA thioester hydrolase
VKSASVRIQVPFHDVDAMEVVWHGHYLKYFELARCALLDAIDYNYPQMRDSGFLWPVVDLKVRYARPATFAQLIEAKATLVEWENRMKIDYLVSDGATGERLTQGTSIQVAVSLATREMCFVSPPVLFEKLGLPVP